MLELVVRARAEEVSDCVVIRVEEQACQIIVMAGGTLKFFKISGSSYCRADLFGSRRARPARCKPGKPKEAA